MIVSHTLDLDFVKWINALEYIISIKGTKFSEVDPVTSKQDWFNPVWLRQTNILLFFDIPILVFIIDRFFNTYL